MNESIEKFLNDEVYILAYRSNYDRAGKVNQELIDYIKSLQQENQRLKENLEKIKQPTIFIDTQDMEERYGEQLYQDYLEEQNKDLKDRIDKCAEEIINELNKNHHLSYGVALGIRQRLINYRELKGSENNG